MRFHPASLRWRACAASALALLLQAPRAGAQSASPDVLASHSEPPQRLGVVVIESPQPSSLPVNIPTTVESITAEEIARRINATDSSDALKYFPSLLVRKRYIGDYDHAVLSTRASGTGNSARSLVYADGILLSNLLGNGAFFTPRWGLVRPEEIDRVDVLYGPFSAAYPGNSVGAVVDYVTRMPRTFEAHARASVFGQDYSEFDKPSRRYDGKQASVALGSRVGDWSWYAGVSRLDTEGQPLVFATRLLSQGTPGAAGTPVTGAVAGLNRSNQPWVFLGNSSQADSVQDHAKGKLQWQITPTLRAAYSLALWDTTVERHTETYLRNAAGAPVTSGTVNIDGRSYTLAATDFPQTRESLQHLMQALSLKSMTGGTWDWEIAASQYDYREDEVRAPTTAPPAADGGGPGRLTDQGGTGWAALALKGIWRPTGPSGAHIVEAGLQRDDFKLRNVTYDTSNWIGGGPTAVNTAFQGDALLQSVWLQDTWRVAPRWKTVLGLRYEDWRADNGATSATVTLPCLTPPCPTQLRTVQHPTRHETDLSPKAALGFQATEALLVKLSMGRAVRMPTVSELFQGGVTPTGTLLNNDPNLKPEKSWTWDLSAEHTLPFGNLRATLFHERTQDALYSQTNVTVSPNVTNIQNVDRIETTGAELVLQAVDLLWHGFDLTASVTYADSTIEQNDNFPASVGKQQPRVPRWRANLVATYRPSTDLSFTFGARYGGEQFNTLDNSDPNGRTWQGVSEFFTTDVRMLWRFARAWSMSLGIDNLNNATYWNFHPYPQRTFLAELRYDR